MRITRSMKTDGPRQAVFNTAELLEAILLEIPMKQLFPIRRVSKQFRDTVNTSIKLQEEMFIRPRKAEKEFWMLRTTQTTGHSLGDWRQSHQCEFVQASEAVSNVVKGAEPMQPALLNPLIRNLDLSGYESAASRIMARKVERVELDLTACLRRPGTWQDMQLTEPPCTDIVVQPRLELNTRPGTYAYATNDESSKKVSHSSGVTFGHFIQEVMGAPLRCLVMRNGSGYVFRDVILDQLVSEARNQEHKSPLVRKLHMTVEVLGMVLSTRSEWEEVRSKSTGTQN